MTVNILFYEDRVNPMDCNVFGVFKERKNAISWLEINEWKFDTEGCIWFNKDYRGFVEIIEKELK